MFDEVMKRFEQQAPVCVMARLAMQRAIAPQWVDEVFAEHRQRQYPRELLFSTVVELMTLVSLGLSPSLHAAATQTKHLPVSLAALYEKVNRTEPAILRALVQGSAQRLEPVLATWPCHARPACLAGVCVCLMAITCRPVRNGWRRCVNSGAPPCPGRPWSSTSRIWDWLLI